MYCFVCYLVVVLGSGREPRISMRLHWHVVGHAFLPGHGWKFWALALSDSRPGCEGNARASCYYQKRMDVLVLCACVYVLSHYSHVRTLRPHGVSLIRILCP